MDDTAEVDQKEEQKPVDLVLQIRLTPEGFNVVGEVVKNEAMALYMLEKAKDVIKGYHVKQSQPMIQKGGMMNFARNIFKRG